jgi:hypothetical protein
MNEGRDQRSEDAALIRRFVAFACVLIVVIGLPMLLLWLSAPKHDPRLFGEWHSDRGGMIWRFFPDGRLERVVPRPPPDGFEPWRWAPWNTDGDALFIGGQQTVVMQIVRWLDRKRHRPTFQIVEVTESTLRLRRTSQARPLPPAAPGLKEFTIPAEEVLTRKPVAKE